MKIRLVALLAALLLVVGTGSGTALAATAWAPAGQATVRPGVATRTGPGICTANFVFTDNSGNIYLGQAAHCSSTASDADIDGCTANSLPVGTEVRVSGASRPGVMVYNSWRTMQDRKERNLDACRFNDFALVRLDPADHNRVNPSVPFWGGPNGIAPSSTEGARVFGFGSFIDRDRVFRPEALGGVSLGQEGRGWSHLLDLTPPGTSGDSGAGVLDDQGRAFGVLSTLAFPSRVNGAGDLARELDYMKVTSPFKDIALALGTEPFRDQPTAPAGAPAAGAPEPAAPAPNLIGDLLAGLLGALAPR